MDPVLPFKSGQILHLSAKKVILNVVRYHINLLRDESQRIVFDKVSAMTGVSVRTIQKIVQEDKEGELSEVKTNRKRTRCRNNSRDYTYDEGVRIGVRRTVHSFFFENIPPTLNRLLPKVNQDENLPNFTRSTMYRLLKDMNFVYAKRDKSAVLIERPDIIAWRHGYLRAIKQYRAEGYDIVYLDESWVNVGHSVSREWKDKTVTSARDAFIKGLSTGLKHPTQRGPRFILVHAGSENGFVNGAEMFFLAKKNSADYHDEMDGPCFENWFENKLLPNLVRKTVIVMDNAPYHSVKTELLPNQSWNKNNIMDWLRQKDIFFEENYLKCELLEVVAQFKQNFDNYKIEELCKQQNNVKVLRLPPYHCELNPIEMVWSQVKRHVAVNNSTFKAKDMEDLIKKAFSNVTSDNWKNYIQHVMTLENKFWEVDGLMEDVTPIVIDLYDSSDNSDLDMDEECT
jgi:transposase